MHQRRSARRDGGLQRRPQFGPPVQVEAEGAQSARQSPPSNAMESCLPSSLRSSVNTAIACIGPPGRLLGQTGQAGPRVDRPKCICNHICVYEIRFATDVEDDLKRVRVHDRRRILDSIEVQSSHQPTAPTRNRKILVDLTPAWEANPPIWELRVGAYRVFYDVDEDRSEVYVRAVREKPPDQRTEDII